MVNINLKGAKMKFSELIGKKVISLFDKHDKSIQNKFQRTPAIYVFKFKKMFYGSYQRWKFIENESEFDLISDEDPIAYIELAKTEVGKNNK